MYPMPQDILSPLGVPCHGRIGIATSQGQKEKKRKNDSEYRKRQKIKEKEREVNLEKLRKQNVHLKSENESFWKENELINGELQSKLMETAMLRSEMDYSRREIAKQESLLEKFSQQPFLQLMVGSGQLEVVLLENESSMFYQKANWNNWISEHKQLLDEIKKLNDHNMILKMQNQVLADKILRSQGP